MKKLILFKLHREKINSLMAAYDNTLEFYFLLITQYLNYGDSQGENYIEIRLSSLGEGVVVSPTEQRKSAMEREGKVG
jgi:hypothetical protein